MVCSLEVHKYGTGISTHAFIKLFVQFDRSTEIKSWECERTQKRELRGRWEELHMYMYMEIKNAIL